MAAATREHAQAGAREANGTARAVGRLRTPKPIR